MCQYHSLTRLAWDVKAGNGGHPSQHPSLEWLPHFAISVVYSRGFVPRDGQLFILYSLSASSVRDRKYTRLGVCWRGA